MIIATANCFWFKLYEKNPGIIRYTVDIPLLGIPV